MPEHAKVLVVAHETAATSTLIEAVRARAQQGPARFHLVVPRQAHGMHRVVDPQDVGRGAAHQVLDDALPKLSDAAGAGGDREHRGRRAPDGHRGRGQPRRLSRDHHLHPPAGISRWLKMDLISKARGLGLPVTHVRPSHDESRPPASS